MSPLFLTIYVLICPVIVLVVLAVILKAFFTELRQAKREGRRII
ncbi:putative transporter small subunit [Leucobacter chinensis]|nr:putative transporter small subunit [Leucobacter chinensis]